MRLKQREAVEAVIRVPIRRWFGEGYGIDATREFERQRAFKMEVGLGLGEVRDEGAELGGGRHEQTFIGERRVRRKLQALPRTRAESGSRG